MPLDSLTTDDAEFLDTIIEFPTGDRFERIRPITDFRRDDSEGEARILYLCRRVKENKNGEVNGSLEAKGDEHFILKVKVQCVSPTNATTQFQEMKIVQAMLTINRVPSLQPNGIKEPIPGPRPHTQAEIDALQVFATKSQPSVPHLVAMKSEPQSDKGLFPGGYVAYVVMTLMPGQNLMDFKFWSQSEEDKEEIRNAFILLLKCVFMPVTREIVLIWSTNRDIWRAGFAPYDCALRNILWEVETKTW